MSEQTSNEPVLAVDDLRVDFAATSGTVHAVRGVSWELRSGRTLAIVGESGSGKSTIAASILRLNPTPPASYPSGSIRYDGRDLLTIGEAELQDIRGNAISMIFQDPMSSLNPTTRVGVQIGEVLRRHRGGRRRQHRDAVLAALRSAGIDDPERRATQYPHQLSGGLRQRVMIAMALVGDPQVLIADEPTTALDVTVQAQILDVLVELQQSRGMALLLITHDLGVVAEVADDVLVMRAGEIVERGPVEAILTDPQHSYTRQLLAATPRLRDDREERAS
ncbi:ABC transporter ATP-binding protein [Microlunatus soli]|uniref:Oligopeptide transport system ATP-binding protein n=1 Tax=Microlunatus soli TaxID=630515 RepID=A0A1H1ZK12_9ACTN|nr:ABC transporter ATP-binding protein [Microlunatus soli]SDT34135.1 oligopeptide transport system ATP-binding protein [Microlunatus soli]